MTQPIVVCGPTASGKTSLAIALAEIYNGEIVSADSMQIYRHMNIGTAKPTAEEENRVVHHMIDVVDPGEVYSAARYSREAAPIVNDIIGRNKTPIICGGTGLYINALISGVDFAKNGEDDGTRALLEKEFSELGGVKMLEKLAAIDSESAEKLHPNDRKRIIRALEVFYVTGKTISEHNRLSKLVAPRFDAIFIGITPKQRQVLYDRINKRVDLMLKLGLEDEVRNLYEQGILCETASQAIGYKEMLDYLNGNCSLTEASELIKQKSRNYAKRQLTWFKNDSRVNWVEYDVSEKLEDLCQKATSFI